MSFTVPALTTAVSALRLYDRRVNRAAEVIASGGLSVPDAPPADAPPGEVAIPPPEAAMGFTEAMITVMIAQRSAIAQLRVIRAADSMSKEAVDLVGGPGER